MIKRHQVTIVLLLVLTIITAGCSVAQRPEPEDGTTPSPSKSENLADRVTALAQQVDKVDEAVAVVVGNIAVVGIDVAESQEGSASEQIKESVAQQVESDQRFVEAYVTADPDLIKRIRNIADGIADGEPITQFLDEITDLLQEIRPQS